MYLNFESNNEEFVFDGKEMKIFQGRKIDLPKNKPSLNQQNYKPFFRNLRLNLFNRCNLSCTYCYANHGSYNAPEEKIDIKSAEKAIDLLCESVIHCKGKHIDISFLGAEPLLSFNEIKHLVNYANSLFPDISFSIVTNGTMINDEISRFFLENDFFVTVSLDGGPKTHDRLRKYPNGEGSFDIILDRISELVSKNKITARITISDDNYDIEDMVRELYKYGISKCTWAIDQEIKKESFEKYKASEKKLTNYLIECVAEKKILLLQNFSILLNRIVGRIPSNIHCSAGSSTLTVDANGDFYFCHRLIGNDFAKIGNLKSIDAEALNHYCKTFFQKAAERKINTKCKKCFAFNLCGGGCYYFSFKEGKETFQTSELNCLHLRNLVKNVLNFITKLKVEDRAWYLREIFFKTD